jgi:hypothetical protein
MRQLNFWGQEKRKRRVLQPSQESAAAAIGTPNDRIDLTKRPKYPSCLLTLKALQEKPVSVQK